MIYSHNNFKGKKERLFTIITITLLHSPEADRYCEALAKRFRTMPSVKVIEHKLKNFMHPSKLHPILMEMVEKKILTKKSNIYDIDFNIFPSPHYKRYVDIFRDIGIVGSKYRRDEYLWRRIFVNDEINYLTLLTHFYKNFKEINLLHTEYFVSRRLDAYKKDFEKDFLKSVDEQQDRDDKMNEFLTKEDREEKEKGEFYHGVYDTYLFNRKNLIPFFIKSKDLLQQLPEIMNKIREDIINYTLEKQGLYDYLPIRKIKL